MQRYFDEALHNALLFKHERKQYSEIFNQTRNNPNARVSNIYGMEHLVRFLMKFSQFFDSENAIPEMNTNMQHYYTSLCKFCEAKMAASKQ